MIGYFRKYIPNFSKTAEPWYVLLKETDGQNNSSKSLISWGETQQKALDQLPLYRVEPSILTYPDHNKEFILHVDASGNGWGVSLLQYQERDLRVISYGSRTLTPAEKKYHSSKLEFLGVKWVVCNQIRDYLYYARHFHIYTGNNPVTYIMSTGRLTATDQRWVNELAEFSFSLNYKPVKQNTIAGTRSCKSKQIHLEHIKLCTETVPTEMVKILSGISYLTQENQELVTVCLNTATKQ